MPNAIKGRNTKYLMCNWVTEEGSEYLRILRNQRNPEYDYIKKEYLRRVNKIALSDFDIITSRDIKKIKAYKVYEQRNKI